MKQKAREKRKKRKKVTYRNYCYCCICCVLDDHRPYFVITMYCIYLSSTLTETTQSIFATFTSIPIYLPNTLTETTQNIFATFTSINIFANTLADTHTKMFWMMLLYRESLIILYNYYFICELF